MPGRADRALAVVIPAYQAATTIAEVLARTYRAVSGATVYVVDDGSTDGTGDEGRGTRARVLVHPENRGKGAALATGIAAALEDGADVIVTLDGDGQHPPEAIGRVAAPVSRGVADLVLGVRERSPAMPLGRRCTNWLSATLASRIGGVAVPDAQTGFRALSRRVAEAIQPRERGYDFETAFLLAALTQGFTMTFVRVPTVYGGPPSHFRPWTDTWRQARVFTRYGGKIIFGAR